MVDVLVLVVVLVVVVLVGIFAADARLATGACGRKHGADVKQNIDRGKRPRRQAQPSGSPGTPPAHSSISGFGDGRLSRPLDRSDRRRELLSSELAKKGQLRG